MSFDHSLHYSDDEWSYLYQPYDWNWPDGWRERRTGRSTWEPELRRICDEAGHPFDPSFVPVQGSHAVFLFRETVVKVYARYSPIWFPREIEALRVLGRDASSLAPMLIAHSDRNRGVDGHPYIIMTRKPGVPWFVVRDGSAHTNRLRGARQMARAVKAIHEIDTSVLTAYRSDPHEWVAIMRARAAIAPTYLAEDLPEHFHDQIEPFIAANIDALNPEFTPVLLSTDVNSGNALFVERDGIAELSGLIDFGDMEVGPLEYEWPSLMQKAFRYNRELASAFFDEYGMALPFSAEQIRRLKMLSLLHRFPTIGHYAVAYHPEVVSLDMLLEMQWAAVS